MMRSKTRSYRTHRRRELWFPKIVPKSCGSHGDNGNILNDKAIGLHIESRVSAPGKPYNKDKERQWSKESTEITSKHRPA